MVKSFQIRYRSETTTRNRAIDLLPSQTRSDRVGRSHLVLTSCLTIRHVSVILISFSTIAPTESLSFLARSLACCNLSVSSSSCPFLSEPGKNLSLSFFFLSLFVFSVLFLLSSLSFWTISLSIDQNLLFFFFSPS